MPEALATLRAVLAELLRGAFGTDGYERYCAHHAQHHPHDAPLGRAAWFRQRETARWNGVSRCC